RSVRGGDHGAEPHHAELAIHEGDAARNHRRGGAALAEGERARHALAAAAHATHRESSLLRTRLYDHALDPALGEDPAPRPQLVFLLAADPQLEQVTVRRAADH